MTNDERAKADGCYFDDVAADRAIKFIETYCYIPEKGIKFKPLDWQAGLIRRLFGWKDREGNLRYKRFILSTGKKCGKTLIQAAILLYSLYGGVCPSPFCVSASTTRENAGQVYRMLTYSINKSPKLQAISKARDSYKEVRIAERNARYKAFSADAGAAEGENISHLVVDELHSHQDGGKLYRALEYATIARPDSLVAIISTAGTDQSSLWYELFQYALSVQRNEIIDTSLLAAVYTAPTDADIDDPATWRQANPSLGTSFSEESFHTDLKRAKEQGTAALLSFRRYRLNQFTQPDTAYLTGESWDACRGEITEDDLRDVPCVLGLDGSATTDPSSAAVVWCLPERRYAVKCHSWVCEEGVRRREKTNLPKYRTFESDKILTITEGSAIDQRRILEYILDIRDNYNLQSVVIDANNLIPLALQLQEEGIQVWRQPQNAKHYTSPIKELYTAVMDKKIVHDGNRFLRWCLLNTRLDVDSFGGCRPDRGKSTDKIDGTVALLMAFGQAQQINSEGIVSPYENHGIETVEWW